MKEKQARGKICVALDVPDSDSATHLVRVLKDSVGMFKIGLELFTAEGPAFVRSLAKEGIPIFLDLKFHDIPNTVGGAARSAAKMGVTIFNVHASGGDKMLHAALTETRQAAGNEINAPLVVGVTILTSFDDASLRKTLKITEPIASLTPYLARQCKEAGLGGVVASPQEIESIRKACGDDFKIITPGIRPIGVGVGDQMRISTPAAAVKTGADVLVIGRPITSASDPKKAADAIASEICDAL